MEARQNNTKLKIILFVSLGVILAAAIFCIIFFNLPKKRIAKQLELGNRYLSEENYDEAIAAFNRVIAIDPLNVDAYSGMADAYIGTGDYENARNILRKGIDALSAAGGDDAAGTSLLQEKLNEVLAYLESISGNGIADSIDAAETADIGDSLYPYYEMPFSIKDFTIAGYSILDGDHSGEVFSAFKSTFPEHLTVGLGELGYFDVGEYNRQHGDEQAADKVNITGISGLDLHGNVASGTEVVSYDIFPGSGKIYFGVNDFSFEGIHVDNGASFDSFFDFYGIGDIPLVDMPCSVGHTLYSEMKFIDGLSAMTDKNDSGEYEFDCQDGHVRMYFGFREEERKYSIDATYTIDGNDYFIQLLFDEGEILRSISVFEVDW